MEDSYQNSIAWVCIITLLDMVQIICYVQHSQLKLRMYFEVKGQTIFPGIIVYIQDGPNWQ